MNEHAQGPAPHLRTVDLPHGASDREVAEFAKGLEIVDGLVARLRTHAAQNGISAQDKS